MIALSSQSQYIIKSWNMQPLINVGNLFFIILEQLAQKREQFSVQIRKQRREKEFQKNRIIDDHPIQSLDIFNQSNQLRLSCNNELQLSCNDEQHKMIKQKLESLQDHQFQFESIQQYSQQLVSQDILDKHTAILAFRKLILSSDQLKVIEYINSQNLVSVLFEYLEQQIYINLQIEAGWCLTNIVAINIEIIKQIVDCNRLQVLINLFNKNDQHLNEQLVFLIANISIGQNNVRDMVVEMGVIDIMINIIDYQYKEMQNSSLDQKHMERCKYRFESTVWAVSSIIRVKPITINRSNDKVFQAFSQILVNNQYNSVQTEQQIMLTFIKLFKYFVQTDQISLNNTIQVNDQQLIFVLDLLINNKSLERIIQNINNDKLGYNCSRLIKLISQCVQDYQINQFVQYEQYMLFKSIHKKLTSNNPSIKQLMVLIDTVQQIVFKTKPSKKLVQQVATLLYQIKKMFIQQTNSQTRHKILHLLISFVKKCKSSAVDSLLNKKLYGKIVEQLKDDDFVKREVNQVCSILKLIKMGLKHDKQQKLKPLIMTSVLQNIEMMMFHQNKKIADMSSQILQNYFQQMMDNESDPEKF